MLEYWGDKAKTEEVISKDGWYKTGDIGSMDAYGYCKIEGRIKDMIIRGGENIYPAEIEQFLHTHPKVKEAQVSSKSNSNNHFMHILLLPKEESAHVCPHL
eukprot:superscaffoldBa00001265_g9804